MTTTSASIPMHDSGVEILFIHPDGPYWSNRYLDTWSIPNGKLNDGKDVESARRCEIAEELGMQTVRPIELLDQVHQRASKMIPGYARHRNLDVHTITRNDVTIGGRFSIGSKGTCEATSQSHDPEIVK